jgi:hypothetical protein
MRTHDTTISRDGAVRAAKVVGPAMAFFEERGLRCGIIFGGLPVAALHPTTSRLGWSVSTGRFRSGEEHLLRKLSIL